MNRFAGFFRRAIICGGVLAVSLVLAGIAGWARHPSANSSQEAAKPSDDASLLEGFRHVEAASVSDALEQIGAGKMYMTHRMRPIFPTKFAGFALTVLLKKAIMIQVRSLGCLRQSIRVLQIPCTSWLSRTAPISPAWEECLSFSETTVRSIGTCLEVEAPEVQARFLKFKAQLPTLSALAPAPNDDSFA